MEPENFNQEVEQTNQETQANPLHQVTPVSKYLAMALFIVLPFVGGYVGYVYAPEKVVEIERNVSQGAATESENEETAEYQYAGVKMCQNGINSANFPQLKNAVFEFPEYLQIETIGLEDYCPPVDMGVHNWYLPVMDVGGVKFAALEDKKMTYLYFVTVEKQGDQSLIELNLYNFFNDQATNIDSISLDSNLVNDIDFQRLIPEFSRAGSELLLYNWMNVEDTVIDYEGKIRSSETTISAPCPFNHLPSNYDDSISSKMLITCGQEVFIGVYEQASIRPFTSFKKHQPKEVDLNNIRPRAEFATPNSIVYTVYYEHMKPTRYIFDLSGNLLHSEPYKE